MNINTISKLLRTYFVPLSRYATVAPLEATSKTPQATIMTIDTLVPSLFVA